MKAAPSQPRLRICMVVDNHYPDVRVEREARALVRHGHEVHVVCLQGEGEPVRQRLDRLVVHRLPLRRQRGMGLFVQLREYVGFFVLAGLRVTRLHLRHRFDVVHVHNVPDFLVFTALVPKLTGARVILDLHDLMPEFFASRFRRPRSSWSVRLVAFQERLSARFADHVITVSDPWAERLVAAGVPRRKVSVLMNLPDPTIFPVEGPSRLTARHPRGSPFTVVYHGTLTARYGVDLLLAAAAVLRDDIAIRVLIHGRGEQLSALERTANELELDGTVEFSTRYMPTEQLPAFLRRAQLGVVPYRRDLLTDGILPTKLMEYAALGIPAIAVRTPMIEHYFTSRMIRFIDEPNARQLADAIRELATRPDLREELARNAATFFERYRWQEMVDAYERRLEQLVAARRRPATARSSDSSARGRSPGAHTAARMTSPSEVQPSLASTPPTGGANAAIHEGMEET